MTVSPDQIIIIVYYNKRGISICLFQVFPVVEGDSIWVFSIFVTTHCALSTIPLSMEAFRAKQQCNRPRDARLATEVRSARQVVLPTKPNSRSRGQNREEQISTDSRLLAVYTGRMCQCYSSYIYKQLLLETLTGIF